MNESSVRPNSGYRIWLVGLLMAHVVLSLVYWRYTPYGVPPDEGPHGLYVQHLVEKHRFPVFDPNDRANYEAHQPPLYYALGVPFFTLGRAMGMHDPAEMVRLLSLILGALSILVIYRAVRIAFPEDPRLGIAAAGFIALLPTHVMLSSSVSNDILTELLFGLALLIITVTIRSGVSFWRSVVLGLVLGLGMLAKTTCLLLLPVAILAYVIAGRRGSYRPASVGLQGLMVYVIMFSIGNWWLERNQSLYGGPLAMKAFTQAFAHTAKPEYWLSQGITLLSYIIFVIAWTFCSFWGVFGHMKVFMPVWAYAGLAVVTLAVKLGALGSLLHSRQRNDDQQSGVIVLYNVVLLLVVLAFIGFNLRYFQAQGRYLYPAILPIAAYWALGIRRLLPERMHKWMPAVAIAIPLAAQIIALATIVSQMPYYQ